MSEDSIGGEELSSTEQSVTNGRQEESVAADQVGGNGEHIDVQGDSPEEEDVATEAKPTIEERLAEAEAKAAEYLDGWQRARAEFANARKRLERGRMEAFSAAGADYVTKLLPIVDDLGRALGSAPPEITENPWFEGLDLVNRKFQSMLESMDVEVIEALGQPFDPNLHEALSLREAEGVESGMVIEELQTGYRLGDKVIRPSLVNVSA